MKVAVVGVGYVGLVAAGCLAEGGNHLVCVDKDAGKIERLKDGVIPIYEPGLAEIIYRNETAGRLRFTTEFADAVAESTILFIAVGTPSTNDGSADLSAVLEVAEAIGELMDGYRIIATKSTVPVGTYKKVSEVIASKTKHPFDYVSNPEFLKEGSAVDDFMKPDRVIVGTTSPSVREIFKQLYLPFMMKKERILFMDPASAELTKYAANVMLATRISFMNEISGLCEKFGADVELVRKGIGGDSRIGSAFLFPGVGYGGSCLPKDVRALIHMGRENGCPMTIAESVQEANRRQQERFAQRVIKYFENTKSNVTLGVWGLAFKARTDDVRESAAIACVKRFLEAGFKVKAYDPEAMKTAGEVLGDKIETSEHGYDILEGCDGLVILTDWQEFRTPDFEVMASKLKRPVIFDGRNLYSGDYVRKQGFEYYSIGRP